MSAFLALPAEIRIEIYRLALGFRYEYVIKPSSYNPHSPLFNVPLPSYEASTLMPRAFALLQTSRQLRTEALPIFYSINTFMLNWSCLRITDAVDWLNAIGLEARDNIRKIRVMDLCGCKDNMRSALLRRERKVHMDDWSATRHREECQLKSVWDIWQWDEELMWPIYLSWNMKAKERAVIWRAPTFEKT